VRLDVGKNDFVRNATNKYDKLLGMELEITQPTSNDQKSNKDHFAYVQTILLKCRNVLTCFYQHPANI
jgi:hypothetical protein